MQRASCSNPVTPGPGDSGTYLGRHPANAQMSPFIPHSPHYSSPTLGCREKSYASDAFPCRLWCGCEPAAFRRYCDLSLQVSVVEDNENSCSLLLEQSSYRVDEVEFIAPPQSRHERSASILDGFIKNEGAHVDCKDGIVYCWST